MKQIIVIALLVVIGLFFTAEKWLPAIFVEFGKGEVSEQVIEVQNVFVSTDALDEQGKAILATEDTKFVSFDVLINLPLNKFDYYDFQLVKRNDYELGKEENVGDNFTDNYFNALPLLASGKIANEWDITTQSVNLRLTFEVPKSAISGYLFYWGEYIGPFEFN